MKKSFIALVATLFLVISLSTDMVDRLRSSAVTLFSPLWKTLSFSSPSKNDRLEELKLENHLLRTELEKAVALLSLNNREQIQFPVSLSARVIIRSPTSWNSSLWISVGEKDNPPSKPPIIGKNSPVVVGTSLVGVVEYVGVRTSRVRLITDPELTPSVRALRTLPDQTTIKLAKGILHGSPLTHWRKRGLVLKGEGFNYDFADDEGPARDLFTGKPVGIEKGEAHPILRVHDLLITTGMDGVFPEGLKVARVTKIQALREGDYCYEIEALPLAPHLEELQFVSVLPPLT